MSTLYRVLASYSVATYFAHLRLTHFRTAFCSLLSGFLVLIVSVSVSALTIDFTDTVWDSALSGSSGSVTYGGLTVTATSYLGGSVDGTLTFNAGDSGGCTAGNNVALHSLACSGDGLGINNDEITQGGSQEIVISFSHSVNVNNILLLDLFAQENSGEVAVIAGTEYGGAYTVNMASGNTGGYFDTGISGVNVSSVVFKGYGDSFSDYAIGAIEVSEVPLPTSLLLFGTSLIGIGILRTRRKGDL